MNSLYYNENKDNFCSDELNKKLYFLSCKFCQNSPDILLKDNERILIECNHCNIKQEEKISNISNYSSEWLSNEIKKPCNLKHENKVPSNSFCKTCNLYICENCYEHHDKSHEIMFINAFKILFCDFHNIKASYYCYNCDLEFCEKCCNFHYEHKYIKLNNKDKLTGALINLNIFENFIENVKKLQKEKFNFVNEILVNLDSSNGKNKEILNKIISKILNIFYKDFKNEQNIIYLSKILFITYKISEKNLDKNKVYNSILNAIRYLFTNEEVNKFKNSIIYLKNKYDLIFDDLTQENNKELENNINNILKTYKNYTDFFKDKKNYIEKNIQYSSLLKKYLAIDKEKNPDKYIDINETLNDEENLYDNLNSLDNESFLLSLFGKCIENNGIEVGILKKKDVKFKDMELASMQSLLSLGQEKKLELHFDFGENENKKILNDPKEKEKFLKDWKIKLCKKLNISEDKLILSDVHRGSVAAHIVIVDSTPETDNKTLICLKEIDEIKKIDEKPMIEILELSPEILDKRGNRFNNWGINKTRGGEKYIPPLNGWYGIGLNVKGKYDNGNNAWLDCKNKSGEYAVAYIGINNLYNDKGQIIDNLSTIQTNMKSINSKLFINDINLRKKKIDYILGGIFGALSPLFWPLFTPLSLYLILRKGKCGNGVCVFQNPDYAENSAGFIDIPGYRIKIMLMCRINPTYIRQPLSFPVCWLVNPNEIRPYRILIKIIPTSPLTDTKNISMRYTLSPIEYVVNSIKSNDYSFYEIANDERFRGYASINNQKVNNDIFVIRLYTSIYFKFINPYLRDKKILDKYSEFKGFTEEQLKSWVCCLQLALSRNKNVKENSTVYRGIRCKFPTELGIGSKFYFQEFMSTSTKKEFCEAWINHEGIIMIITIKNNGTNGHPNYCYYIEDITVTPNQYEVLISSHCYFTITKIEHNNKIDYIHLICEGYLI